MSISLEPGETCLVFYYLTSEVTECHFQCDRQSKASPDSRGKEHRLPSPLRGGESKTLGPCLKTAAGILLHTH